MRTPSSTVGKIAVTAATPVAVIAAAALIWQSSYAAFTSTTRNSGNDWATGSVALTDDDAGSARFQVAGMLPGDSETKCITVTANTTSPGLVKAYVVNSVAANSGLADHIALTINTGTGGSFASCTGFVAHTTGNPLMNQAPLSALTAYNSYATGVGGWAVAAGTQSRTYQITWVFDTAGLTQAEIDSFQGTHTGIDLQWELQSD